MDKIKFTTDQELAFQKSLEGEKKHSSRVAAILGAILFVTLTIINYFALPVEENLKIAPITIATLLFLGVFFVLSFKDCFLKHYNKIGLITFLSVGSAICVMIAISTPDAYTHNVYFVSLILLIVTIFSWSYMPRRYTVSATAILIALFLAIKVFLHEALNNDVFVLVVSLFFLVSAAVIVAMAQVLRDGYIRRNFLLQEQLQVKLEEEAKEAKLQKELANRDALTGLPNRRFISKALDKALQQAKEQDLSLVLLFLDLNGFKAINDTFGHDAGDEVLKITSERLKNAIRKDDYLARLGGDEFLVGLLIKKDETEIVDKISTEIRTKIINPVSFGKDILKVGTSIGVASYPQDGDDVESLIKLSDENMYADKILIKSKNKF